MNKQNDIWLQEYSAFMMGPSQAPDRDLERSVAEQIQGRLNPSPMAVFVKIGFIQVLVGSLVLLFCPQFGYSPTGVHGIMHIFMRLGNEACMVACGALFVGSSLLVSSFALSYDELRVLRQHPWLQIGLVSLLTAGIFLCFGAEVIEVMTLLWLGGSIIGGFASLSAGLALRKWIQTKVVYA